MNGIVGRAVSVLVLLSFYYYSFMHKEICKINVRRHLFHLGLWKFVFGRGAPPGLWSRDPEVLPILWLAIKKQYGENQAALSLASALFTC